MKKTIYLALVFLMLITTACQKDKDNGNSSLALNTWRVDVANNTMNSSVVYSQLSGTFSTQGYQLLEMKGDDNLALNHCWLKIYFNTIGPPPSGTYTVTSYNNLRNVQNGVAVMTTQNGNTNIDAIHTAEANQTIHVIFADGKLEIKFDDLKMFREGNYANSHAKLSVNLRK